MSLKMNEDEGKVGDDGKKLMNANIYFYVYIKL